MGKKEMWIELCFDTNKDFCKQTYTVNYDNFQIIIEKGNLDYAHNIHLQTTERRRKKAYTAILNLLSEISWLYQCRTEIFQLSLRAESSAKTKGWIEPTKYKRLLKGIDLDSYSQIASNDDQKFALGLYREAISSGSHFYSFLNYYKIITISHPKQSQSVAWINKTKCKIQDGRSKQILYDLETNKKQLDIGTYLWSSGRCAVAHAKDEPEKPIISPNDYEANARILYELPLIKAFTDISMKDDLQIATRKDILKQYRKIRKH